MDAQAKACEADAERLLSRSKEFETVLCPACSSDAICNEVHKKGFRYALCNKCGTMYMSPRPTTGILEWYSNTSENYKYWSERIFPASENARRKNIFRPRAEMIAKFCQVLGASTEILIDIGAGFGTFCEEIRDLNIFRRVIAIEPTPGLYKSCINRGIETIELPIEKVDITSIAANIITSFETIEHLYSPADFLSTCSNLLAPEGLLVLTCPNIAGFEASVLGILSSTISMEHLNYFNPQSMTNLLAASGFDIVELTTPGRLDVDIVRKQVQSGKLSPPAFLSQLVSEKVGHAFQEFLSSNLLSSHMQVIAQKLELA